MKTVVLASKNPVKLRATLSGFERIFPGETFIVETVSVPSGVSDQPMTSDDTLTGARNRARNAEKHRGSADFWVGIEGGIEDTDAGMSAFAWIVVRAGRVEGRGRTGTFFLPHQVASLIRQGKELGEADDIVFNRSNSKQEEGAIGILTGNVVDRTGLYEHAVILALVPFRNKGLYDEGICTLEEG
jgi:inosine/xanthosine triphosphatase